MKKHLAAAVGLAIVAIALLSAPVASVANAAPPSAGESAAQQVRTAQASEESTSNNRRVEVVGRPTSNKKN